MGSRATVYEAIGLGATAAGYDINLVAAAKESINYDLVLYAEKSRCLNR